MTEQSFEIARLLAIFFTIAVKLYLMPWYLQAYLDMAYHRTQEQKKEAGRITNIDFQKKVSFLLDAYLKVSRLFLLGGRSFLLLVRGGSSVPGAIDIVSVLQLHLQNSWRIPMELVIK